jgi:hypothetical protein
LPQLRSEGGEPSAPATPGLILLCYTTQWDAADQGRLVFPKDHLFKSPSGVAIALLGRTANGWREWKNPHGQTLHELIREP